LSRKPPQKPGTIFDPLTGRNVDGVDYQRTPAVERQITASLSLSDKEIVAHAALEQKNSDGYLQEESLVYLIRKSFKDRNRYLYNDLAEILMNRCEKDVSYRHRALVPESKEDARAEFFSALFEEICAPDGTGDFLQVRFWSVVGRMAIDVFRKYYRPQAKDRANLQPGSFLSSEKSEESEDAWETAVPPIDQNIPDNRRGSSAEMEGLKNDALQVLEEPIRTVFYLHHYEGWPIESSDPDEPTLSKQYKVTPKTIGNWLRKAESELTKWRGDHHE
jgi:hypothetical protein